MSTTSPLPGGRLRERPAAAQTGTELRMSSLPNPNITSTKSHSFDRFEMNPSPLDNAATLAHVKDNMYTAEEVTRKCVYTYDDKYTFSRIIAGDSLIFDSHFESGNLHSAFRVLGASDAPRGLSLRHYYDLFMHNDLYTAGHTQWYYFSVANMKVGQEVTFYIKNFAKPDSLYNAGMLPLLYSMKKRAWVRAGSNVCYFSNNITDNSAVGGEQKLQPNKSSKKTLTQQPSMYSLSFTYIFEHSEDLCYFAYCHPYTYSDLRRYLRVAELDSRRSRRFRRTVLCKTLGGNVCDLLTITSASGSAEQLALRAVVILTARVHPGESNASWIMQGILDFLLGDSEHADFLRENFVFKVVPMLNPDGVINGNYRTNLSGVDLNRAWSQPDPLKHPTVFAAKELIVRLARTRTIGLLLDIHGHSKELGLFFYSCIPDKKSSRSALARVKPAGSAGDLADLVSGEAADAANPTPSCSLADVVSWKVRLFPRILESICQAFMYKSCSFKMHKSKASTMRIVAFAEIGIDNAYTLEASLAGKHPWHFGVHDLLRFGADICAGICAAAPAMSLRQYSSRALLDIQLGVARYLKRSKEDARTFQKWGSVGGEDEVTADFNDIYTEIPEWRPYYDVTAKGVGVSLLSELGQSELFGSGAGGAAPADSQAGSSNGNEDVAATAIAQTVEASSSSSRQRRDGAKKKVRKTSRGITYNLAGKVPNFVLEKAPPAPGSNSSSSTHGTGSALWLKFESLSVGVESGLMITPRTIATAPLSTKHSQAGKIFEKSAADDALGGKSQEFRKLIRRVRIINAADSCALPDSPAFSSRVDKGAAFLEKKASREKIETEPSPDVFFNRQIVKLQSAVDPSSDGGLTLQPIANAPTMKPPASLPEKVMFRGGRKIPPRGKR